MNWVKDEVSAIIIYKDVPSQKSLKSFGIKGTFLLADLDSIHKCIFQIDK